MLWCCCKHTEVTPVIAAYAGGWTKGVAAAAAYPAVTTDNAFGLNRLRRDTTFINQNVNALFLFENVQIPQGSTIASATLRIRYYESLLGSDGVLRARIRAWATDSAPLHTSPPTWSGADVDALTRTVAASPQFDVATIEPPQSGNYQNPVTVDSPDIASVLQEIVSRPGWAAGGNILMMLEEEGSTFALPFAGVMQIFVVGEGVADGGGVELIFSL